MVKRKVVKQGAATLMVSLPSKWAKKFNLQKGDELDVEERGKDLVLSAEQIMTEKKSLSVDISQYGDDIHTINGVLSSLYDSGIEELELKFADNSQIKDFKKRVINYLLGWEIVKQTQKSLVIKEIATTDDIDQKEIVRRIFFILDSMCEELVSALKNKEDATPVIESDESLNKFCHLCFRILSTKGYSDFNRTTNIYMIISELEKAGDRLRHIAIRYNQKVRIDKEQISILIDIRELISILRDIFFNPEIKLALDLSKQYNKIKSKINNKNIIDFYLYDVNSTIVNLDDHIFAMMEFEKVMQA